MKYLLVILLAVVAFLTISQPSTCEGDIRLKGDIAVCQIQQGYLVSTRDGQERLVQNWHLGGVFFDRVSFYRYCPYAISIWTIYADGRSGFPRLSLSGEGRQLPALRLTGGFFWL